MDNYVDAGRRKTKNDNRAKRRARVYKQGGQFRATGIKQTTNTK